MVQFNALLSLFLILFLAAAGFRLVLSRLNIRHLKTCGHKVPPVFAGRIDETLLAKMSGYTADSSRFGMLSALVDDGLLLLILLSGILPWYAGILAESNLPFVAQSLLFLAGPAAVGFVADIPFDLYDTFVIEKRYGFSTTTVKLWIIDLVKSLLISIVIIGILLACFFTLLRVAAVTWWIWAWLFFAIFQMAALWLYPVLIAPLFNKYEPVADEVLRRDIVSLVERAGLRTKAVLQVDAGKRSRHSNAYFTGLGKTKRIVLYDTLLASHGADEILSILAHEIGHWKKRHIIKKLLFIEAASLLSFYLVWRLLDWTLMYRTFGFDQNLPYAGLFLLSILAGPLAFFLKPAGSFVSRRQERQADEYAKKLIGSAKALSKALMRLAEDNLANLHPHPVYAWFYYSHPPLAERIARLQAMDGTPAAPPIRARRD